MERNERAHHILDVAADLMLRWGYDRVTIEEIASHAEVGRGTIYLHWKTKEALFGTLLLREVVTIWRELLELVRRDPQQALFHNVIRSMMLAAMQRPLARVLFTRDKELLGKLARTSMEGALASPGMILQVETATRLRSLGLLRSDADLEEQMYAGRATVNGFLMLEALEPSSTALSLERKANALADTIRRAFEPDELLTGQALREAGDTMAAWVEQICLACEQQMNKQLQWQR